MGFVSRGSDLRDPWLYVLVLVAAVLGLLGALVTTGFVEALDALTGALWRDLPEALGVEDDALAFAVPVCVVGGMLVGLARKRLGEYPRSLETALEDFRRDRAFDYRHIPQAIVLSLVSLGFGAALGPEAALVAIVGGLGSWIGGVVTTNVARRQALVYAGLAGTLGALFSTPGAAALPVDDDYALERPGRVWILLPGLAAAGAGVWLFSVLSSGGGYLDFDFPSYEFAVVDLGWAALAALAGTALALVLETVGRVVDRLAAPLGLPSGASVGVRRAGARPARRHLGARALLRARRDPGPDRRRRRLGRLPRRDRSRRRAYASRRAGRAAGSSRRCSWASRSVSP